MAKHLKYIPLQYGSEIVFLFAFSQKHKKLPSGAKVKKFASVWLDWRPAAHRRRMTLNRMSHTADGWIDGLIGCQNDRLQKRKISPVACYRSANIRRRKEEKYGIPLIVRCEREVGL